jgi:acetate kinase
VTLDPAKNASSEEDRNIAAASSNILILVIHAQEEWEIARECWRIVSG